MWMCYGSWELEHLKIWSPVQIPKGIVFGTQSLVTIPGCSLSFVPSRSTPAYAGLLLRKNRHLRTVRVDNQHTFNPHYLLFNELYFWYYTTIFPLCQKKIKNIRNYSKDSRFSTLYTFD